jgi:tetratricopeptide (TPR) repeat protein
MASWIRPLVVILLLKSPLAWNQERSVGITGPSQQLSEPSISTARLRVPRKAREFYEKAIKLSLKHDDIEAQEKLDQALHLYPAFPEALTMRGSIQLDHNQWEAGEQSLQAAVRSDPTYGMAYLVLSRLYNVQRRFDEALAMSQRATVLIPNSWPAQYEMCSSFMGKHQYVRALSISDAALQTHRGTLLHVVKAHALIGLEKYSEAVVELRTYLHYQPAGEGSQDAHDLLDRIQNVANQRTR